MDTCPGGMPNSLARPSIAFFAVFDACPVGHPLGEAARRFVEETMCLPGSSNLIRRR